MTRLPHHGLAALRVVAALGLATTALAMAFAPSGASADNTWTVNSTADTSDATPNNGVCADGSGFCSLRAAVEESNANAVTDTIHFDATVFTGTDATSTITLGSALTITTPIHVDGADGCGTTTTGGNPKPCVGVKTTTGLINGFVLSGSGAGNSSIDHLAIYKAFDGIWVQFAPSSVAIRGNWFGMDLSQSLGASNANVDSTGVFSNADTVTIGGATPAERNVFANANPAIQISEGDHTTVTGNYIGTDADGQLIAPTSYRDGIEVNNGSNYRDLIASNNVIGGPDTGTPGVCDGACNLIAVPTIGFSVSPQIWDSEINLDSWSNPPAGSTTIQGNFVGQDIDGTVVQSQSIDGVPASQIRVGDATDATIGGATAADGNFIGGGTIGVNVGDPAVGQADRFVLEHNQIGVQPDGTGAIAPRDAGAVIAYSTLNLPDQPTISGNSFAGDGTAGQDGLRLPGFEGVVTGNSFGVDAASAPQPFGANAISVTGAGYAIDSNTIQYAASTGVDIDGGSANELKGNSISNNGTGGTGAGVRIENGAGFNQLGPDPISGNPLELNRIYANSGDAIELLDDGTDSNTIFANASQGMALGGSGTFIDLNGDGAGNPANGPNEGIAAPEISTATLTQATGTAMPFAEVLLFANGFGLPQPNTASLGTGVSDGSGNWSITYSSALTGGETVFANQTNANGSSSELSAPVSLPAPITPPGTTPPGTTPPTSTSAKKKCKKHRVRKHGKCVKKHKK
jgi:CSLREA domain-containing protein